MVTSQTRRSMMITEGKKEAIRLEKESIRLQKESIRLQKEAIRLEKEEIRLQKKLISIRLEKEAIRLRKEEPGLDEGFYEVEDVREKRVREGQTQYLIKWLGWPEKDNTWEPIEHLQQCLDSITAFEERGRKRKLKSTQVNSKMLSHASHGSPRKSACRNDRRSSKGHKPVDDTATAGTEAPNDNGSPLENQPLLCHKESPEEPISCIPHHPGKFDLLKDDRSFALKVTSHGHLVGTERGNGWKPFPSLQPNDVLQTGGTSPIMSSFCQTDLNTIQDIPFANTQTSGAKSERQRSWADGKAMSGSGKVVDRVAAKEGKALEEVTAREQIKGSGGNSLGASSPSSFGVVNCVAPAEEMRPLGFKPSPVLTGRTSSLPDLNTSIPTSALFQHPLTDSQQVQLRAQIFVYGSLIDGTKPDEACMISAFGESDGGRSIWENVWRVAVFQHQKSPLTSAKLPAEKMRSFCQSDAFSTPDQAGGAGGVGAPPTMISPLVWELEIKQIEKAQLQSDSVSVLQQKVEELENKNKELQEQLESVLCENRGLQEKHKREVTFEKKTNHMQGFGEESNYSELSK